MELNILIYTHTDYKDVWPPFFGQLKKFLPNAKLYVLVDKYDINIPSTCEIITYDNAKLYTERLKEGLNKLTCNEFLFIHEDMYLYDKPNLNIIEKYIGYIKNKKIDSVKLIYVKGNDIKSILDESLLLNEYSKFSIQPTLISKDVLLTKLNIFTPSTIYEFEENITNSGNDFMCKIGDEIKRGTYHYDSTVFPYIATAIVKGKWNYLEYKQELEIILNEYNINKNNRGIFC